MLLLFMITLKETDINILIENIFKNSEINIFHKGILFTTDKESVKVHYFNRNQSKNEFVAEYNLIDDEISILQTNISKYGIREDNLEKINSFSELYKVFRIPVFTLIDYLRIVKIISDDTDQKCVYRGHANNEWELKSSIERKDNYLKDNLEKKIFNEVIKYNLPEINLDENNILDTYIRMQHYGIPTRLLDWSFNPLIALYFALDDNKVSGEVIIAFPNKISLWNSEIGKALNSYIKSIVSTDGNELNEISEKRKELLTKNDNNDIVFLNTIWQNNRIKMQQGLFSYHIDKNMNDSNALKSDFIKQNRNLFVDNRSLTNRKFDDVLTNFFKRVYEYNCDINLLSDFLQQFNLDDNILNKLIEYIKEEEHNIKNSLFDMPINKVSLFIPADKKESLKSDIEKIAGINVSNIYPDFQGLSLYIKNKYM